MGPIGTKEATEILSRFVNNIIPVESENHYEQNLDQARTILIDHLRKGFIKARYLDNNCSVEINNQYWASKNASRTVITSHYQPYIDDPRTSLEQAMSYCITVEYSDIQKIIGTMNSTTGSGVNQFSASVVASGRPLKYDWEEVMFRMLVIIYAEGLPKSKAKLLELVATDLGDDAPGDTQLKKRISRVFDELTTPGSTGRKPLIV